MRRLARGTIALAALMLVTTGVAEAGSWYYKWSCTGECSPGRLVIEGREGPFATREECEWVRDRDTRADEFVRQGNLGGLSSCEEEPFGRPGGVAVAPSGSAPTPKTRISAVEMGLAVGTGWSATGEDGSSRSGTATLGFEVDSHAGRDLGGGSVQLGMYATWVDSPMLGAEPRSVFIIPLAVGLALTPKVWGRADKSARLDLGASAGGFLLLGCSDCPGAVFQETLAFGYSLKAGVDIFHSKSAGVGLDVIFPRWSIGSRAPGDLLLESPAWMVRVSMITRPPEVR